MDLTPRGPDSWEKRPIHVVYCQYQNAGKQSVKRQRHSELNSHDVDHSESFS